MHLVKDALKKNVFCVKQLKDQRQILSEIFNRRDDYQYFYIADDILKFSYSPITANIIYTT